MTNNENVGWTDLRKLLEIEKTSTSDDPYWKWFKDHMVKSWGEETTEYLESVLYNMEHPRDDTMYTPPTRISKVWLKEVIAERKEGIKGQKYGK